MKQKKKVVIKMADGLVYKIRRSTGPGEEGLWTRVTLEDEGKIVDLLYLGTNIMDAYKSIPFKNGTKIYLERRKIDIPKEMERAMKLLYKELKKYKEAGE